LHTNYNQLFLADNDKMELMNLFLPLRLTVFIHKLMVEQLLTHAPVGGSMDASAFGINGGWEVSERQQLC
jgi:hypothetical protein